MFANQPILISNMFRYQPRKNYSLDGIAHFIHSFTTHVEMDNSLRRRIRVYKVIEFEKKRQYRIKGMPFIPSEVRAKAVLFPFYGSQSVLKTKASCTQTI